MESNGEVAVLVPAAGSGRRLGGRRKQYRLLGGAPLLVQTIRRFDLHDGVHHVVVAAPAADREEVERTLRAAGLRTAWRVVPGGATRQASVGAALRGTPEAAGLILVHDAVRPFVTDEQIAAVIAGARTDAAAALAVPASDTLRHASGGYFEATVSREGLYRMQTPQGFQRRLFEEAHRAAASEGVEATDDVALVQRLGARVRLVHGDAFNLKITTPADWELAQVLWSVRGLA